MSKTVLVVDDEPDFLELLSWALQNRGYNVENAADGVEAVSKALSISPDLIILDLMLPELDGTAVCEILRQTPQTASIPVIMLTGCATEACKWVSLDAGVTEYLTKPCSLKTLMDHVTYWIQAKAVDGEVAGAARNLL